VTFAGADLTSNALSGFSSALRVPVHVAALLLLAVLAFELGRIATESWRRIRPSALPVEQLAARAMADPADAGEFARLAPGPLTELAVLDLATASRDGGGPDAIENALAAYELRIQRRLDRTRILVRAGPALGLMGTLIPLSPALTGLAKGNTTALSQNLRIAFSVTVIGLLIGAVAFGLSLSRDRMYGQDLSDLEYLAAVVSDPRPVAAEPPPPTAGSIPVTPPPITS
jgi:biopolymer transport protein ExbB/TolQ